MKVLLVGGGGREHALGWKIAQSPELSTLYAAPGNPGLSPAATRLSIAATDVDGLVTACRELSVDLVVVGPEAPLALGLADRLREAGIACFGPSAAAARLESSKAFMKEIAAAAGAPTAAYGRFEAAAPAQAFLRTLAPPYVVKADGLAEGKGVVIAASLPEADAAVEAMLAGQFGAAGATVVIEEFLEGEEASFFAITDGRTIVPLIAAQDHKRAFDGDKGPNTGGMGAYSPAPVFTSEIEAETVLRIIRPVVDEMARRGSPYCGVLFAGLMIGRDGPKLIEFNARFGDPECQVLMRRLTGDLLPTLRDAALGRLSPAPLDWSDEAAAIVVMASDGYPGAYRRGDPIGGVTDAERLPGVVVFHAGTGENDGRLVSSGGRVLGVSAVGVDIAEALSRAYAGVAAIDWPQGFYRRDIGWRAHGNKGPRA